MTRREAIVLGISSLAIILVTSVVLTMSIIALQPKSEATSVQPIRLSVEPVRGDGPAASR